MYTRTLTFGILIMIVVLLSGCYYDNEEYLYPQINNQCDTTNVTFSGSVMPVLQTYCISCHTETSPTSGVSLGNYTQVHNYVTNTYNGTPYLDGVIRQKSGFLPMPQPPSPPLDECSIRKIEIWINSGAQNN